MRPPSSPCAGATFPLQSQPPARSSGEGNGGAGTICAIPMVPPVLASSAERSEEAAGIRYQGLQSRKEGGDARLGHRGQALCERNKDCESQRVFYRKRGYAGSRRRGERI
ncbi:unnamed protein product [Coccothraustes coccothraustes]